MHDARLMHNNGTTTKGTTGTTGAILFWIRHFGLSHFGLSCFGLTHFGLSIQAIAILPEY